MLDRSGCSTLCHPSAWTSEDRFPHAIRSHRVTTASTVSNSNSASMTGTGCPFGGTAARPDTKDIAMCPFAPKLKAADTPAATCPLGFGTARGPKLSTLHCPVCKSLLFDAHVTTSCRHTFCRSCISQTRDCPSCGRDVDGLEPNTELAGLVDTFLDTHSKSPELVAAQADLGPLPDNSAASFYMAQGLKSLTGGNIHAAMHRLGRAKQALLDSSLAPRTPASLAPAATTAADVDSMDVEGTYAQQQQQGRSQHGTAASEAVSKAVQMATVCGVLGDCYQRLGEPEQAEQQYKESAAAVERFSEESAEAAHAMSVSLNKLGDARYLSQQLPAAKALYRQALQLRQLCCGPLTAGQAGPQEQLELAASFIKLGDVCKALGESEEAEQQLRRAHGVCCEVHAMEAAGDSLAPQMSRKLHLLLGVLQAQGLHWGVQGAAGGQAAAAAGGS